MPPWASWIVATLRAPTRRRIGPWEESVSPWRRNSRPARSPEQPTPPRPRTARFSPMTAGLRHRLLEVAPTVALIAVGLAQLLLSGHSAGFRGPTGVNAAFLVAVSLPLLIRREH